MPWNFPLAKNHLTKSLPRVSIGFEDKPLMGKSKFGKRSTESRPTLEGPPYAPD
jgi:hypothetical protein